MVYFARQGLGSVLGRSLTGENQPRLTSATPKAKSYREARWMMLPLTLSSL
jgi:hypothetical protein